ncbi:hypothetical protein KP79_PYT22818 [Mizuhopecten yessoensis]|uniref:PHR domain-containing protein n=1 Tax=Mizuhopecten yessoensis TaxID=6573 RepID=A0A210R0X2_MIZYE|nr:hypothetical protein KP79_PYT22818 [Mizuhopecten yessoensis]
MFLHGLQLYGSCGSDQNVLIGVYSQDGDILCKETHTVLTNETLCNTEFQHIIKITRDHTYTVVLHGGVHTMGYGEQGCSTVECRDGQIRFIASSSFSCRYTPTDKGQIPGLLVSF